MHLSARKFDAQNGGYLYEVAKLESNLVRNQINRYGSGVLGGGGRQAEHKYQFWSALEGN